MKKWVKIALAIAIALPILAAAAFRFFVDANTFRPAIESRLTQALSRKVTVGDLSLSLMTASLVARDFSIADDPNFGQTPFITAKELHIGVQMKPLLFSRQLIVRSFEIDDPKIHLIQNEAANWNFSTLSRGAASKNPAAMTDFPVELITIKDGQATIEKLPSLINSQVYDHLDVKLENFSLARAFPFSVNAAMPGDGNVTLSGTLGPLITRNTGSQNSDATPFDAQLTINHLDPVAAGYIDQAAGISMFLGLDAHIVSDGIHLTSSGKLHAGNLILLKGGKATPQPLDLTYQVAHSLKSNSGELSDLALQTGDVALHIKGTYQLSANDPVFDLKLLAQSLPIDGLQAMMPAIGVKLPNGATLQGGTLSANFGLKGSLKDNVIDGSYEIKNTKLVGFDLGSKIVGIAALGGIKTGDTLVIDLSRADMRITKSGSETTNIYSVIPALGESTGSGSVSPTGELNFHLISKVTSAKGLNKVGINLLTKLNSTSASQKSSTESGIPINITGTAENPVITADVHGLMKGNAEAFENKTGLSKLFKKKNNSSATTPAK